MGPGFDGSNFTAAETELKPSRNQLVLRYAIELTY